MLIYDDNRPENIRSTIAWLAGILAFGLLGFNVFLPNNDVNIGIGVLIVSFSTMVLTLYGVAAARAILTGSVKHTDYLIVGICLSWFATEGREIVVIIARLANLSPAILNSDFLLYLKLLYPIAAILHVLPKGAVDGVVPKGNKVVVISTFAIATVLAVVVVSIKPDTTDLIEKIPMWLKDYWRTGAGPPSSAAG